MKIAISIIIFFLCLYKKRSKFVFCIVLVWLWFLMTYCGETLDSSNYINEFANISLTDSRKEPLYVLFVYFFQSLGIQYETYHAISAGIAILLIGRATYKLSKNQNLVLALFMIYPFALYAVQIRNCFAFSLAMNAMVYLNRNNDVDRGGRWHTRNKNELLYCALIICATLVHSAYIIFLFFLLAEKFNLRKVIIATGIALAVLSVVMNRTILLTVAGWFNVRARLEYALYFQTISGQSDISLRVIITFVMYILFLFYVIYRMKTIYGVEEYRNLSLYNENMFAVKLNVLCLVILPIIPLIREVFRIQEALMLFNYIVITNNMDEQPSANKETTRNLLILASLLFVIFVDDFLYILRFAGMREFVLHAVFG